MLIDAWRSRKLVAALVIAVLGAGGFAASAASSRGIQSSRVVYRPLDADLVIGAVLADLGVPLEDGGKCPVDRLRVSYADPGDGWQMGAYIGPLGTPEDRPRVRNGIVRCRGSHFGFVGFQATMVHGHWSLYFVPDPHGGLSSGPPADIHEDHLANLPDYEPVPVPALGPLTGAFDGPQIEGYARYEGQIYCDPDAKPGTLALRNLLLAHYPTTTTSGISRACDVGGRSEHKEGRAFDWGADVDDPQDREAVDDFVARLLANDAFGNQHAIARRMGVMYIIWDGRIWNADTAVWEEYHGTSPHMDHVHISMSWAGAMAQTSFWSGTVVEGMLGAPSGLPRYEASPSPTPTPTPSASATPVAAPVTDPSPTPAPTVEPRQRRRTPRPTAEPTEAPPTPTATPSSAPPE